MGEAYRVVNLTRQRTLAERADLAADALSRMRGLLGTRGLPDGGGLLLDPCNSIHMFFMRYPIDVAFIGRDDRVVGAVHAIGPWRMTRIHWRARRALELPAGTLQATATAVGDELSFEAVTS